MKVYFLSPINMLTPLLFETMVDTFENQGHQIVSDINEASVIFLDLHSRVGKFDWKDFAVIINKKLPVVIFDFTDYGGCKDETSEWIGKNNFEVLYSIHGESWASALRLLFANKIQTVFFVRKMDKTEKYQDNIYPIEMIQYPDCIFEPTTAEELFSRPYDICFVGNHSPLRMNVCKELEKHFKCDFMIGCGKMPHNEWLERHRHAKYFISLDGGGMSDERSYQLITVAAFLKNKNNHLQYDPFEKNISCMEVSEVINNQEIEDLWHGINNKEKLYEVYLNGIAHMRKYYNATYRSKYILSILQQEEICE